MASRLAFFRRTLRIDRGLGRNGFRLGRFSFYVYRARLSERLPWLVRPSLITLKLIDGPEERSAKLTIRSGGVDGDLGILAGVVFDQQYRHDAVMSARTVLDLGSHIGIAATWFHLMNPDIDLACVEPDPRNLELLEINLAQNGIEAEIVPCAVSGASGQSAFGMGTDPGMSSLRTTEYQSNAEYITVEAKTLPEILDQLDWDRADLVKMDIEGAEESLLGSCGDWADRVTTIVLELHPNVNLDAAQKVLRKCGFSLRQLGKGAEPTYVAEREGDGGSPTETPHETAIERP